MAEKQRSRNLLEHLLQRYLLPGIAVVYLLAAYFPDLGIWLRSQSLFGTGGNEVAQITCVNILLAGLLFNTGLAVPFRDLLRLSRQPRLIILGLAIRITSVCLIIVAVMGCCAGIDNPIRDAIVLGLVLVSVMPVANSSAAWSHHSDANVGLSMWLILISVLLSPILVKGLLMGASFFVPEEFVPKYLTLADGYAGSFVMIWVIIPALLGVITRTFLLKERYDRHKLFIKTFTSLFLLTLNYANGAVSLPQLLHSNQLGLISLTAFSASGLCALLFVTAWSVSRICRIAQPDRLAVMYSTAMSNTGVALVLITSILPQMIAVHLVVIFYTLIQHMLAGLVDELAAWGHSTASENQSASETPCTMTSQPVLKDRAGRPTTQTGSHAAMYETESALSNGSE